ncbi:MAG: alpha/beta hydrolase [Anaerolineae bacterium]|nr:alpha/beta hydrolase [Anaerolineae bacterium]
MSVKGIYGRKDSIVSPKQRQALRKGVDKHTVVCFEQSGHFPMLDETEHSHQAVLDFLPDSE